MCFNLGRRRKKLIQAACIDLRTVAPHRAVLLQEWRMLCSILDTSSFFIFGLSFLFLMLVFISLQGLDLWRNKSHEGNSLEMRHCTELKGRKKDLFIVVLSVGGQFVSHREILDHLSCLLLRNCCCKRLTRSWSSCSRVGNMEKEESHRPAHSVWEDLDDSAHTKMTWNLCIDTWTNPSSTDWMLYASRGGMFCFHHTFNKHIFFFELTCRL